MKGTEWGTEGGGRQERNQTDNGKKGGRREQGGQRGPKTKRRQLMGNAAEYQEAYRGRGAD